MKTTFVAAALAAFALAACSSTTSSTDPSAPPGKRTMLTFETILRAPGHYSNQLDRREIVVINNQAELERQWARIYQNVMPRPEMPNVNFNTETLLLATSGTHSTGGYAVEIESLISDGTEVQVITRITEPGPGCFVTEAFTTPVHLIQTTKITAPIDVEWRTTTETCD